MTQWFIRHIQDERYKFLDSIFVPYCDRVVIRFMGMSSNAVLASHKYENKAMKK